MWAIAAPDAAASSAEVAISPGEIGKCGVCSGRVRLPVIAHVKMTFRMSGVRSLEVAAGVDGNRDTRGRG